jgi:Holliday junction resolvase RusA-like endonuclease
LKFKEITIPVELVSLNEFINAHDCSRQKGARIKKQQTKLCATYVKAAMNRGLKVNPPVYLHFQWFMKDKKKDLDNVAFAKKFIQDGMVWAKLIPNDNWRNIIGFTDDFYVDPHHPRVEIYIEEVEKR